MRKITEESVQAFEEGVPFKKSNMKVKVEGLLAGLYLFDNLIATKRVDEKNVTITNAGWKSNTTKERLNGLKGVDIRQSKGVWYLNGIEWDGKTKLIVRK